MDTVNRFCFSWFPCSVEEVIKKSNDKIERIRNLRIKEDEETIEELVQKYNRFYYKPWYWFINLFLREKYVCNKETVKTCIDREIYLSEKYDMALGNKDLWNYPSSACLHQEKLIIMLKNAAMEASILGQKEMMLTANDWDLIS